MNDGIDRLAAALALGRAAFITIALLTLVLFMIAFGYSVAMNRNKHGGQNRVPLPHTLKVMLIAASLALILFGLMFGGIA